MRRAARQLVRLHICKDWIVAIRIPIDRRNERLQVLLLLLLVLWLGQRELVITLLLTETAE